MREVNDMTHKRGIRKLVIVAAGGLMISGILSGPASAQNDPFHGIFEEGYDFLNKTVHNSVEFPDRRAVLDEMPSRALFGDGYAVTRSPQMPMTRVEPVRIGAATERSPFETTFGEGYKRILPR
jgi:hypothetical protein